MSEINENQTSEVPVTPPPTARQWTFPCPSIYQQVTIQMLYSGPVPTPDDITRIAALTGHTFVVESGVISWDTRTFKTTLQKAIQMGLPFEVSEVHDTVQISDFYHVRGHVAD